MTCARPCGEIDSFGSFQCPRCISLSRGERSAARMIIALAVTHCLRWTPKTGSPDKVYNRAVGWPIRRSGEWHGSDEILVERLTRSISSYWRASRQERRPRRRITMSFVARRGLNRRHGVVGVLATISTKSPMRISKRITPQPEQP
jgi:hypothetical protein